MNGDLARFVRKFSEQALAAYEKQPSLVEEHSNQEQDTARGGYADRQLVELIQNAADQIHESDGDRIEIVLDSKVLYCADNGNPLDKNGVSALLTSHRGTKRNTAQIGRFGVGFKSVLGVTDSPSVFSHGVSMKFDRAFSKRRISAVVEGLAHYPVLRIAEPMDAMSEKQSDETLGELMQWATNIVRLPLRKSIRKSNHKSNCESEIHEKIVNQIRRLDAEFLLFVPHVKRLEMRIMLDFRRLKLEQKKADGAIGLCDGNKKFNWMIFSCNHRLSQEARDDSRTLDNAESVEMKWAAPLDRTDSHQHFWAFFPTKTASLVGGILNAPWKTNEDRQNLLEGKYNDELIEAAAKMIANHLPRLANPNHPARHLDVLPRRRETGDNQHADRLRTLLYSQLKKRAIAPNQKGELRKFSEIRIPPKELSQVKSLLRDVIELWKSYPHCPTNWLHSDALESNRLALLGRIFKGEEREELVRARISEWLEALIETGKKRKDEVAASRIAIQTAALLKEHLRRTFETGNIVFTATGDWLPLEAGRVFLNGGAIGIEATRVHSDLESNPKTLNALMQWGIEGASIRSCFQQWVKQLAAQIDIHEAEHWHAFWKLARQLSVEEAAGIVRRYFESEIEVHVLTMHGSWMPIYAVLLPGAIAKIEESAGSRSVVNADFHKADLGLLKRWGAVDSPKGNFPLSPRHWFYRDYLDACRWEFQNRSKGNPKLDLLKFINKSTSGPLEVFRHLGENARARLTEALLDLDETYEPWEMHHTTRERYGIQKFPSPALKMLCDYGRIFVEGKAIALTDGFGEKPKSVELQHFLLTHSKAKRIRESFPELHAEAPENTEPFGADEAEALLDVWSGLKPFLKNGDAFKLIRCDGFANADGRRLRFDAIIKSDAIFVRRFENESDELKAIALKLELDLSEIDIAKILKRTTAEDIENARANVRNQENDVARLLMAVGEKAIRKRLPDALIRMLQSDSEELSAERIAEAAIALHDTGTLRKYKNDIAHLDPPQQWAGRPKAVEFVRALGFSDEWAGMPKDQRAPFVDETGPFSLAPLHKYQLRVVENIREMLRRVDRQNDK